MTITAPFPAVVRPGMPVLRWARMILLFAVTVLLLAIVLGMAAAASAPAGSAAQDVRYERVTVQLDDNLWSIAESVADGRDVPEVMDEIMALNGMHSRIVHPGQILTVPVGGPIH